jgi:hypothetical protein
MGTNNNRRVHRQPSIRNTIESCVSEAEFFNTDQTIILFDWDDTLCPSSWIQLNRREFSVGRTGASKSQRLIQELQRQVAALLKAAMTMGKVIIVTNATEPWVTFSCKSFLPQLVGLVSSLPVIYARSVFENQAVESKLKKASSTGSLGLPALNRSAAMTGNMGLTAQLSKHQLAPQKWKEAAFLKEINGFYSRYDKQSWKNILSIGDSVFERDAARQVVTLRPSADKKCLLKTVKLLDEPSLEELVLQVGLILNTLNKVVHCDSDLSIEISEEDLSWDNGGKVP